MPPRGRLCTTQRGGAAPWRNASAPLVRVDDVSPHVRLTGGDHVTGTAPGIVHIGAGGSRRAVVVEPVRSRAPAEVGPAGVRILEPARRLGLVVLDAQLTIRTCACHSSRGLHGGGRRRRGRGVGPGSTAWAAMGRARIARAGRAVVRTRRRMGLHSFVKGLRVRDSPADSDPGPPQRVWELAIRPGFRSAQPLTPWPFGQVSPRSRASRHRKRHSGACQVVCVSDLGHR